LKNIKDNLLKKVTPFVLTLFFIILLFVPFSLVTNFGSAPAESVVEARTLVALEPASNPNLSRAMTFFEEGNFRAAFEILLNLYTSASFVNNFEQATNDQFPFRMSIIQFSKALDRQLIKLAYSATRDTVIPADTTSDIYFDSENNQLVFSPTLFNESIVTQIDERVQNYKELIKANPNHSFSVYYHQTLHNSEFHPLTEVFSDADKGQGINYFEKNLPDNLSLKKFMLTSMDDHLQYYYRTDHHWTVDAILLAYEEIHDLLSSNYPEISPILEIKSTHQFEDIEFLGLLARRTFFPIKGDDFSVEIVDFPPNEMYIRGNLITADLRSRYFSGDYSMIPYTNHFNEFYGNVTYLIEYRYDNDSNRNLLIIGSSFRNALDPLLASHYNHTYCIDLRYNTNFSLSEFLAEHDVDDILIIGDNAVAFEDIEYWKINP
jgi:hypothetical protein